MLSSPPTELDGLYGQGYRVCPTPNPQLSLVLSTEREIDLYELEQLCDAVGWSRRPLRRVRKALENSLLVVGLWRHDPRLPRLVGFARCTGDGVRDGKAGGQALLLLRGELFQGRLVHGRWRWVLSFP